MTSKIEAPPQERLELALAEALPKLGAALKNSENPGFKQSGKAIKYADLSAVIEAIRPVAEHGVWYRQVLHEGPDGVTIETLYTGFGTTISAGTLYMPAAKRDAQGFGSALTYARRYALQTAFGLATEDDDGNAGVKTQAEPVAQQEMPDAEYDKLIHLVGATKSNVPALLKYLAINVPNDNLRMLNQAQYGQVLDALNDKMAKLTKTETDAKAKETVDA